MAIKHISYLKDCTLYVYECIYTDISSILIINDFYVKLKLQTNDMNRALEVL